MNLMKAEIQKYQITVPLLWSFEETNSNKQNNNEINNDASEGTNEDACEHDEDSEDVESTGLRGSMVNKSNRRSRATSLQKLREWITLTKKC